MCKIITLLLILITSVGCKKDHHSKVEIYLLNKRKNFKNCIPVKESDWYRERTIDTVLFELTVKAQYDTIKDEVVFAGEFDALKSELNKTPFIKDDEIKYLILNKATDEVVFNAEATKRINELYPENSYGNQFVVTVDGTPVLTGYFWTRISRFKCDWYQISAPRNEDFDICLGFENGDFKCDSLPYPKRLTDALRASGRLIQ